MIHHHYEAKCEHQRPKTILFSREVVFGPSRKIRMRYKCTTQRQHDLYHANRKADLISSRLDRGDASINPQIKHSECMTALTFLSRVSTSSHQHVRGTDENKATHGYKHATISPHCPMPQHVSTFCRDTVWELL
ncbi:hypothetical protein NX059_004583 [Plenodomus lindquistii]|nr:hypothetical protein NX059_004583 [Plenodomus lindquistii]